MFHRFEFVCGVKMNAFNGLVIFVCILNSVYSRPKNIILFLTDDQDLILNSMTAMQHVNYLIGKPGATFQNAFVNTPICCPSRSTLLTGKYLHNTGVHNNSLDGNCSSRYWQTFQEPFTMSSLLKIANYSTFYAGKYLNQYGNENCGGTQHVPIGYDWWLGLKGNSKYYNYTLSINGTAKQFTDEYLTDVIKSYALSYLNQKRVTENPFFMILSTPAPHAPFTPAPRHRDAFPTTKALRTPSFNFSAVEKHWLLRMPPKFLPSDISTLDVIQRKRFQTLLAVDELVEAVILKLKEIEVINDTYILYTSDNGFHIGQFAQPWDKRQPYETDIRVPLLIRGPGIYPGQVNAPVSFVDLAPTILDMAGMEIPSYMDGVSFLSAITSRHSSPGDPRSGIILIEYQGEGNSEHVDSDCPWLYDSNVTECTKENWCKCQDARNNSYVCIRHLTPDDSVNFKYCQFDDDEDFVECYDLLEDPYELTNVYKIMDLRDVEEQKVVLNRMKICKGSDCHMWRSL